MAVYKFIYWRDDIGKEEEQFANVHLLRGYGDSLASFNEMVGWLRETFPDAKDEDITVSKVTKSSYCQGFSIITWTLRTPRRKGYRGWTAHKDCGYYYA